MWTSVDWSKPSSIGKNNFFHRWFFEENTWAFFFETAKYYSRRNNARGIYSRKKKEEIQLGATYIRNTSHQYPYNQEIPTTKEFSINYAELYKPLRGMHTPASTEKQPKHQPHRIAGRHSQHSRKQTAAGRPKKHPTAQEARTPRTKSATLYTKKGSCCKAIVKPQSPKQDNLAKLPF